jgi:hypothetical protein
MKKINKAFVLGGSGYVGQYLVEELAKDNIENTCLINKTPIKTKSENITQIQSSLADFDWHQLDGNIPDVIFNTARMSGKDKKSRLEAGRINATANQKMLEWMKAWIILLYWFLFRVHWFMALMRKRKLMNLRLQILPVFKKNILKRKNPYWKNWKKVSYPL